MTVLFVHLRNALRYYSTDKDTPVSIPLPNDVVFDMEVADEKKYVQSVTKVLGGRTSNQNTSAVLVLSDELCYAIRIDATKIDDQKKQLINTLPFSHVEMIEIHGDKDSYIVATNADLYETAVRVLSECGYTVALVVPWSAVIQSKLSQGGEIDRVTVKRIVDAQSALKNSGYPMASKEPVVQLPTKLSNANTKTKGFVSKGWIIFGIIAGLYAIGMLWFMLRK